MTSDDGVEGPRRVTPCHAESNVRKRQGRIDGEGFCVCCRERERVDGRNTLRNKIKIFVYFRSY